MIQQYQNKLYDISTQKQKTQERKKAEEEQIEKQKLINYNKNVLPKMLERDQQKVQLHKENSKRIDDYFYS